MHRVYDDGTREREVGRFYDVNRDEQCQPARFSDGARYCAPIAAGGSTVFVVPTGSYFTVGDARYAVVEVVDGPVRVPDGFVRELGEERDCRCEARAGSTCIPYAPIAAVTPFAEPGCVVTVSVEFVPNGSCQPPMRYAANGDTRYPLLEPTTRPLYQLEPGDRCGDYAPPPRFVVHALGEALDPAKFPNATLEVD